MADDDSKNCYEEARKRRVLDNQKRFEDLGILKISKSLSDVSKSEKKPQLRHCRRIAPSSYDLEPRRSQRARNPVPSYRDEVDLDFPTFRKRSKLSSSWESYVVKPLEECKVASYEQRANAFKSAEKLQSNLQSENPSFVKSMVRSHVYSCFWLGLPTRFCAEHLPKSTVSMVLEDEDGLEHEAVFISKRTGLSGGWRAFALDHKLDDGDALVFELVEPARFKVYIVRASTCLDQNDDVPTAEVESDDDDEAAKKVEKRKKKRDGEPEESKGSKKERVASKRNK